MTKYCISDLLKKGKDATHEEVIVKGWVRSFRSNRFISLNDGTSLKNIQVVVDFENFEESLLKKISVGCSLKVIGSVVESQGRGQDIEIQAKKIKIYGEVNPEELQETILQPKKHSLEKLREQAHLRFRTNTFGAIMRVRHAMETSILPCY